MLGIQPKDLIRDWLSSVPEGVLIIPRAGLPALHEGPVQLLHCVSDRKAAPNIYVR